MVLLHLHSVDVFNEHLLLWGCHLLCIDRLLRRMLRNWHMNFLVVYALLFWTGLVSATALVHVAVMVAVRDTTHRCLALTLTIDGDVSLGTPAAQFLFARSRHTDTTLAILSMLLAHHLVVMWMWMIHIRRRWATWLMSSMTEVGIMPMARAVFGCRFRASTRSCVVIGRHGPWRASLGSVLQWAILLVRELWLHAILRRRDNTVLSKRVIDRLRCSDASVATSIATLLLFVHILTQPGLLLGWKLVPVGWGVSIDVLGGSLSRELLAAMRGYASAAWLDILARGRLVYASWGALTIRSSIFAHNILEGSLIKISAWLLLWRFVDVSWPTCCVWHHEILLIARAWYLGLHCQVVWLMSCCVLLLAQA